MKLWKPWRLFLQSACRGGKCHQRALRYRLFSFDLAPAAIRRPSETIAGEDSQGNPKASPKWCRALVEPRKYQVREATRFTAPADMGSSSLSAALRAAS